VTHPLPRSRSRRTASIRSGVAGGLAGELDFASFIFKGEAFLHEAGMKGFELGTASPSLVTGGVIGIRVHIVGN
jgi:hypothetical protein